MRVRDTIGLVFVGILLTLGVGGYLWWEFKSDNPQPLPAKTASESSTSQQQEAQSQNNQTLQVQGVNPVNPKQSDQSTTPSLPGPSDFKQYEEHKDTKGVLFIDEVVGSGDEATSGVRVAMFYKGWLTDGQLFDQTKPDEEGQIAPFVFDLGAGNVIAGWDQGIIGMKVGGKRRLVIPSDYGYGPSGQGPIPSNAMLIFDVELVGLQAE